MSITALSKKGTSDNVFKKLMLCFDLIFVLAFEFFNHHSLVLRHRVEFYSLSQNKKVKTRFEFLL